MSRQNKLILKRIGLHKPTMVELNGKILVTQDLMIDDMCRLWRQYFGVSLGFGRTDLYVEKMRDFNAIQQRTLASEKSVMELFAEQDFYCVLLPKDEGKSDWELCQTIELVQKDNETQELKSALVGVKKERDELRARLEKAIEFPCKVGDTIYYINPYRAQPKIDKFKVISLVKEKPNDKMLFISDDEFFFVGDEGLFFTRAEAEARLKELQGE